MKSHQTYMIYSDGGSRGNPGPSAAAFIIKDTLGQTVAHGGEYVGIATNNQAEYLGVLLAIKELHALNSNASARLHIDSQMVVNQLNGIYKVRNRNLWPIHQEIMEIVTKLGAIEFIHVPRELNESADSMVNKILDEPR